VKYVEYIHCRR